MANHCFCNICLRCPAPAAREQSHTYEHVMGPPLVGQTGFFVHFADNPTYTSLAGRELFRFGSDLRVGISGIYYSTYAPSFVVPKQLRLLGLGGRFHYALQIPGLIADRLYQTRTGELNDGSELTLKIGCGGRVRGVIKDGLANATIEAGLYGGEVEHGAPTPPGRWGVARTFPRRT